MNSGRVRRKFKVDHDCVVCRHKCEESKKREERLKLKTYSSSKFDEFNNEKNSNARRVESNGEGILLIKSPEFDETKNMNSKKRKISKKSCSEVSKNTNSKKARDSEKSFSKGDSGVSFERNLTSKKRKSTFANLANEDERNKRKDEFKGEGIKRKKTKVELNEEEKMILRGKCQDNSTRMCKKISSNDENFKTNGAVKKSKTIKPEEKLGHDGREKNVNPENGGEKKFVEKHVSRNAKTKNKRDIYSKRANDGVLLKENTANLDSEIDNLEKFKTPNSSTTDPSTKVANLICEKAANEIYEFSEVEEEENKRFTAMKNLKVNESESTAASANCKNNFLPKVGEKLKNFTFDFFGDKNVENSKAGNTVVRKLSVTKEEVGVRCGSEKIVFEKPKIQVEIKTRKFECKKCRKNFAFVTSLYRHNKFTHNKTKLTYACHQCGCNFSRKDCVETHIRYHCAKNPTATFYACDYENCEKKFKSRTILKKHYSEYHSENTPVFTCAYCEHSFRRKSTVSRHIPTCASYKIIAEDFVGEFTCAHCARTFKRRVNLSKHLKNCEAPNNTRENPANENIETTDNGLLLKKNLEFPANNDTNLLINEDSSLLINDEKSESNDNSSTIFAGKEIWDEISGNYKRSSFSANIKNKIKNESLLFASEEIGGNDVSLHFNNEEMTACNGSLLPANDSSLHSENEAFVPIASFVDEKVIGSDNSALPNKKNAEPSYRCWRCASGFNRKSNLYRHERSCRVKKAAGDDKDSVKNRERRTSPIRRKNVARNFACPICDFRFTRKEHLTRHAPRCEAKNKVKVSSDAKNDDTRSKLKRDRKIEKISSRSNGNERTEKTSELILEKITSSETNRNRKNEKTFLELKGDRKIDKIFACDICDYSFSRKYHLERHFSKCKEKNDDAAVENISEFPGEISLESEPNPTFESKAHSVISSDSNVENERKMRRNDVGEKAKIKKNNSLGFNCFICPTCKRTFNRKLNFTRHTNAKIRKCVNKNLGEGKFAKNSRVVDSYLSFEKIDNDVELLVPRANPKENSHSNSCNFVSSGEDVSGGEKNIRPVAGICEERFDKISDGNIEKVDFKGNRIVEMTDQNAYLKSIGLRKIAKISNDTILNESDSRENGSQIMNREITVERSEENQKGNLEDKAECGEDAKEICGFASKEEIERNLGTLMMVSEGNEDNNDERKEVATDDRRANRKDKISDIRKDANMENIPNSEGHSENILQNRKKEDRENSPQNRKEDNLANIYLNRVSNHYENGSQNRKEDNLENISLNRREKDRENSPQNRKEDNLENILLNRGEKDRENIPHNRKEDNLENISLNRREKDRENSPHNRKEDDLENINLDRKEKDRENSPQNRRDDNLKSIFLYRRGKDCENSPENRKEDDIVNIFLNRREKGRENSPKNRKDDNLENIALNREERNAENNARDLKERNFDVKSSLKIRDEENSKNQNIRNRREESCANILPNRSDEEEITLMCAKCESIFHSERSLTQHYTSHIFANDLPCIHCDRFFEDEDTYESHLLSHYFFA